MNQYTLIRHYRKEATTGVLITSNGKKICQTLERPNFNNQKDNPNTPQNESSCIPEGTYFCKKYSSKKYPDTWEITGVKGRDSILFHCANYISELLGCIAICNQVIDMNPKEDPKQDPIKRWLASQSRDGFAKFKKEMPKEFILKIISTDSLCNT